MIGNELKESKDISLSEVLEILEKRKKRSPLGYEQQTSYDYCTAFVKLSLVDTKRLIEELMEIEEINEKTAIKIVDIIPVKESQLKIILAKERIELSPDKIQKVFEILLKYKDKSEEYLKRKQKKKVEIIEDKKVDEDEEKVTKKKEKPLDKKKEEKVKKEKKKKKSD